MRSNMKIYLKILGENGEESFVGRRQIINKSFDQSP